MTKVTARPLPIPTDSIKRAIAALERATQRVRRASAFLNVLDFGSSPGAGGRSLAGGLQEAIRQAAEVKMPVLVPAMSTPWKLHRPVEMMSGVTVQLARGAVVEYTEDEPAITGDGLDDIALSGPGIIRGPGDTFPTDPNVGLVYFSDCTDVTLFDLEVEDCRNALFVLNSDGVWVQKNRVHDYLRFGIVTSQCRHFHVDHNWVRDCTQDGADVSYGVTATGDEAGGNQQRQSSISFNHIENIESWDGIMTHDTADLAIIGNNIRNVRQGIDVSTKDMLSIMESVDIIGNTVIGTDTDTWGGSPAQNIGIAIQGLDVAECRDIGVHSNHIRNFNNFASVAGAGGIWADWTDEISISGNRVRDIGDAFAKAGGVTLSGRVRGASVKANNFLDTNDFGVLLYNSERMEAVEVQGNTTRDSDGSMLAGVFVDSVVAIDCHIGENPAHGTPQFGQSNSLFQGVAPFALYGAYNAADAWRNPIATVGACALLPDPEGRTLRFRLDTAAKAAHSSGDGTTFDIDSTTGVEAGDAIHFEQDDGRYHDTFVASVVDADTITVDDDLPAGAGVSIGNEVYIVRWKVNRLEGRISYDPASVGDGAQTQTIVSVSGAEVGDPVFLGFSQDLQGMRLTGYVEAPGDVRAILRNDTGGAINLAQGILSAVVMKA